VRSAARFGLKLKNSWYLPIFGMKTRYRRNTQAPSCSVLAVVQHTMQKVTFKNGARKGGGKQ
jgi:hypothetical protein